MADETRTVLIDVEVENRDFDKEIGEVNSALVENNKQISELKKNYSENATEIAKLEANNRALSKTKGQLIKESQTEANSLDALRLKLAKLTAERNSTNTSTAEGAARFEELQVSIKNTSDAISGFEQQGGDFRRNVGNYPELLDKATGGFLTLFRTLLANPIGIIIAALAGLVSIFAKTQTGAEFFRKAGALLNTTLGKLKDVVEFVGAALISAFENPKKALDDLVSGIRDGIVKYFTEFIPNAIKKVLDGFGLLGKAAKQLFTGDFSGALDTASDAALKLVDGITDIVPITAAIKAVTPIIADFASEINNAANAAFDLETAMIANEKAQANLAVAIAKGKVEFIQFKTIAEDTNKTLEERIKAAQKAFDLENGFLQKSIDLQQEKIDLLKAQNDLTNSTEEDIQRVRDAEIELATLQEASYNKQLEISMKLTQLRKEDRDKRLAALAEEQSEFERAFNARAELAIFESEQRGELEKAEIARRNLLLLNTQLTEEERQLIIAQSEAKINDIRIASADQQKDIEQALTDFRKSQNQSLLQTSVGALNEIVKNQKALGLVQLGIDTGVAIGSALRNSQSPTPDNVATGGLAGLVKFATIFGIILTNSLRAKALIKGGGSGGSATSAPVATSSASTTSTTAQTPQGLAGVNATLLSQFTEPSRTDQRNNQQIAQGVANSVPQFVSVVEINKAQENRFVKVTEAQLR